MNIKVAVHNKSADCCINGKVPHACVLITIHHTLTVHASMLHCA